MKITLTRSDGTVVEYEGPFELDWMSEGWWITDSSVPEPKTLGPEDYFRIVNSYAPLVALMDSGEKYLHWLFTDDDGDSGTTKYLDAFKADLANAKEAMKG